MANTNKFSRFALRNSRLILVSVALLAGCTHLGPRTMAVDRFDYSAAIADSWKQQSLLNIVKVRYMDVPVFVDVASIVAGYSLQTGVSVGGVSSSGRAVQGDYGSLGGQAIYTDRPTITYVPLTGEKFLRGLITPIEPKNIFFMLQSGYAADFILGLTVESLNGVSNRAATGGQVREAEPDFIRALALLREIQNAGAFSLRVEEDQSKGSAAVVVFRQDDLPAEIMEKGVEVRRLLKLPPDGNRFKLTFGPGRGGDLELAVNSRSMLQIMSAFASYVDVPAEHLDDHSAVPGLQSGGDNNVQQNVRIRSGKERPESAYAAVRYRDYWFWIYESDLRTKRAMTAFMYFFTMADTGGNDKLPLITIPAQ
jgi:hypothetical protein